MPDRHDMRQKLIYQNRIIKKQTQRVFASFSIVGLTGPMHYVETKLQIMQLFEANIEVFLELIRLIVIYVLF